VTKMDETITGIQTEVSALRISVDALKLSNGVLANLFQEHDKILVRGNGKPSMQEDVRNLTVFIKSIKFWMTALALAFIGQFAAVGLAMVIYVLKSMP